ncbi:hypothetical protein ACQUWZ_27535, partial [Ralstonia pseudosolanacearum]|uniref:hypothetical protein n=1 Tax=Ralstonia pseudosolanacearum TaxID=1310165 RepID=UPI003D17113F
MATQKQIFTEAKNGLDSANHTVSGLIGYLRYIFGKLENATGGGGGGSVVSYTQTATSGAECGTITIDGDAKKIYAPIPFKASSAVSAALGATTATITDSAIATTSTIDIFSETSSGALINVKSCVVTTGQAVLT